MQSERSADHYSDEVLIAYADGEVRYWAERALRRHLRECWQCRTRLAELDRQAGRVAALLREEPFPAPDRMAAAKLEVLRRQRRVEAQLEAEAWQQAAAGGALFPRAARIAASVAVASVVGLGFWIRFTPAPAPVFPPAAPLARSGAPAPQPPLPEMPAARPRPRFPAPHAVWMEIAGRLEKRPMAARELDLRLALHNADACSGEPVEIEAAPDGAFVVKGVVRDAARRGELEAAIAEADAGEVRLKLKTMEEAAADASATELVAGESNEFRASATPFERLASGVIARDRVVSIANAAVGEAESILAHAWALHRIERRFPRERLNELNPRERVLLSGMVEDHLRLLERSLARLRGGVEPALRPLAGPRGRRAEEQPAGDWFAEVRRAADLARHVFAGAEAPGGEAAPARELLDTLSRLDQEWDALAARLAAWEGNLAVKEGRR